jgi:osmotically-inducible protein OsmY
MKAIRACLSMFASLAACLALSPAVAQQLPADPAAPIAPPVQVDVETAAANVSGALKRTQGLPPDRITVSTHASNIVLTGQVDTEAQRAAALSAAEKAAAGVRISANVEVKPLAERSPQEQLAAQQATQLVRDVEAALKADSRTANLGITVSSTEPQKVMLQGLVPTAENRTVVQTVVSKVKGVTQVDNRLLVP